LNALQQRAEMELCVISQGSSRSVEIALCLHRHSTQLASNCALNATGSLPRSLPDHLQRSEHLVANAHLHPTIKKTTVLHLKIFSPCTHHGAIAICISAFTNYRLNLLMANKSAALRRIPEFL
jgi:hypothetical protein